MNSATTRPLTITLVQMTSCRAYLGDQVQIPAAGLYSFQSVSFSKFNTGSLAHVHYHCHAQSTSQHTAQHMHSTCTAHAQHTPQALILGGYQVEVSASFYWNSRVCMRAEVSNALAHVKINIKPQDPRMSVYLVREKLSVDSNRCILHVRTKKSTCKQLRVWHSLSQTVAWLEPRRTVHLWTQQSELAPSLSVNSNTKATTNYILVSCPPILNKSCGDAGPLPLSTINIDT